MMSWGPFQSQILWFCDSENKEASQRLGIAIMFFCSFTADEKWVSFNICVLFVKLNNHIVIMQHL